MLIVGCSGAFSQGQVTRPGKQTTAPAKPKSSKPSKPRPSHQPPKQKFNQPSLSNKSYGEDTHSRSQSNSRPAKPAVQEPPIPADRVVQVGGIYYKLGDGEYTCVVVSRGTYAGEVIIPSNIKYGSYTYQVKEISEKAFSKCEGLISVSIPNTITKIGKGAFEGCYHLKMSEFASIESLCSIEFEYFDSNPINFSHKLYINGQEITNLVIPSTVISIGKYAFMDCLGLTSVTFPNSLIEIKKWAFYNCKGLTSLQFPNSLNVIGWDAFHGCDNLSFISIPSSVTEIGYCAFENCGNLKNVHFLDGGSSITIYKEAFKNTPVAKKIKKFTKRPIIWK